MIERKFRNGALLFDRDAIIRAALRAYVESVVDKIARFSFAACAVPEWTGDLERGGFMNRDGCGNYTVVAWTEAGIVALAYELGFGPIEHLDLPVSAVTGGPDDVRGALPDLPDALEPALVLATGMLDTGDALRKVGDEYVAYGEKLAGVGFWLHGDQVAGTLFTDRTNVGARQLAMWGWLRRGRLLSLTYCHTDPRTRAILAECDRNDAPAHAVMDAVVDRALKGPTEFTPAELETLLLPLPTPPPKRVLHAQRMLAKVGITWPGSPRIPEPPKRPEPPNPFLRPPGTVWRDVDRIGNLGFERDAIVRAAKRAYVQAVLAQLDPLKRYDWTVCAVPRFTGDMTRGAFFNGHGSGDYEVIAWNEAGIVGLAYQRGVGPIEQLGLSASAIAGGPGDVYAALPDLPAELEPALEMAAGLLDVGAHGEKLASVGFWLLGAERVEGTLFNVDSAAPGVLLLAQWGRVAWGTLVGRRDPSGPSITQAMLDSAEPIQDLVEWVAERALNGPTELTTDEIETLLPTPVDPDRLLHAQRMLEKVGVTWPGSPKLPEAPR